MKLLQALLGLPGLSDLPVLEALPQLAAVLGGTSDLCALQAPPGSGKTILAPLWLQENPGFRRVLVLVPRRVNARLPVLFLESCCGAAVGYRIRFESRWDERSIRAGYLTYGTALRYFVQSGPGPDDLVIFDEFHERPWEADVLLAHLLALRRTGHGPRLLLMSATLDTDRLPPGTPMVSSLGRLHPVSVTRESADPMLLARPEGLPGLVARRSAELGPDGGEQLIFLPGLATIRAVEALLRSDDLGGSVDILHSSLPEREIRRVVERPAKEGFRRILSTDLAESSVTLPGVSTVLDAGMKRRPRRGAFALGITLQTVRAPLSSLLQRTGRAGRLGPGRCHRLLTHQDELHRETFARPEISQVDGKSLALQLAALGRLEGWSELPWLEPPDCEELEKGREWLARHHLLSDFAGLTPRGLQVLSSTCSPRAGLFGLLATEAGWSSARVVDWTSAVELGPARQSGQALTLHDLLEDKTWLAGRDPRLLQRLRGFSASRTEEIREPLLRAYSDTLVEIKKDRAVPRDGSVEALIFRHKGHVGGRFGLVLATIPGGRDGLSSEVSLYQPVSEESLWEELFEEMEESSDLEWDETSRAVKDVRRTRLGNLVLEEQVSNAQPRAAVAAVLARHLNPSDFGEPFAELCRRLSLFLECEPELAVELRERIFAGDDLREGIVLSFLETVHQWGRNAPEELLQHARDLLGYPTIAALDKALPTSVQLPGRARPVSVVYPPAGAPYIASKLQDFFGWRPPRLLNGHLRLAIHLLAPSGRPVQITEDLEGFWKGSYQRIRKDLRGRYPKHSWPENP